MTYAEYEARFVVLLNTFFKTLSLPLSLEAITNQIADLEEAYPDHHARLSRDSEIEIWAGGAGLPSSPWHPNNRKIRPVPYCP